MREINLPFPSDDGQCPADLFEPPDAEMEAMHAEAELESAAERRGEQADVMMSEDTSAGEEHLRAQRRVRAEDSGEGSGEGSGSGSGSGTSDKTARSPPRSRSSPSLSSSFSFAFPSRLTGGATPASASSAIPYPNTSTSTFFSPTPFTSHPATTPTAAPTPATAAATNRRQPPENIPDFPSAHSPRNPPPAIPFSPSPTTSPATPHSPFRSPGPGTLASSSRAPSFSIPIHHPFPSATTPSAFTPGHATPQSPWHSLAASSGAPTPSLDGPVGRSSPHLGYPFERLNIGGSWSGGNLGGEAAASTTASASASASGSGQGAMPGKEMEFALPAPAAGLSSRLGASPPQNVPPPSGALPKGGLSAETILQYRSRASSSTSQLPGSKPKEGEEAAEGSGRFSASLARRNGSLPAKLSPSGLNPPAVRAAKPSSPLAAHSTPTTSPGQTRVQPLTPGGVVPLLAHASTLVLDVRPPSSFQASHVRGSHSLPIPSTLLRRPAFTLQKLTQMLSPHSQDAVSRWREKSDIILVDGDSGMVQEGSVLDGLASKFGREGFGGRVWFLKGGHAGVRKAEQGVLVSGEEEEEEGASPVGEAGAKGLNAAARDKGLMAGKLSSMAFHHESTGGGGQKSRRAPPPTGLNIPPTPSLNFQSNPFGSGPGPSQSTDRPNHPLQQLKLSSHPFAGAFRRASSDKANPGDKSAKLQPANPFFDNIRQNLELAHGGITERIPLALPESIRRRAEELPGWLRELVSMPEKDSMDELAKQFYELELHEQKRLQAVMDWHAKGSGAPLQPGVGFGEEVPGGGGEAKKGWEKAVLRQSDVDELQRLAGWEEDVEVEGEAEYFPFSIAAGVERGTKNRYKNIWPYDFSRVRLASPPDEDSDYINASFIQPRGTSRRYIATQGPLDATYRDFWTLVWEQDVRVIVMITKQYEGGLIKCGNYWEDQRYGPIRLHIESQVGGEDPVMPAAATGFDFGMPAAPPPADKTPLPGGAGGKQGNIKRLFSLSRSDRPDEPARKIVQIQCVGWPDFDVPETPGTLLDLIREVDVAVEGVKPEGCKEKVDEPPLLVHCSAGVGRTGSFIVVDAILDGLRREISSRRSSEAQSLSDANNVNPAAPPSESVHHSKSAPNVPSINPSAPGKPATSHSLPINVSPSKRTLSGQSVKPSSFTPSSLGPGGQGVLSTSPGTMAPLSMKALGEQDRRGEEMEVDPPKDAGAAGPVPAVLGGSGAQREEWFMKWRGSTGAGSVDSSDVGDTRRPSLASAGTSSQKLSSKQLHEDLGSAIPVTRSNSRHRTPSPISEMDNPVSSVLEGMRVQRMSLVQTLRQYLFVYRAIITHYVSMLDDELSQSAPGTGVGGDGGVPQRPPLAGSSASGGSGESIITAGSTVPTTAGTTGTSGASGTSSGGNTDDESHIKRRASPTELHPELRIGVDSGDVYGLYDGYGGASLTKRPSFKKMKPAVAGMARGSGSVGRRNMGKEKAVAVGGAAAGVAEGGEGEKTPAAGSGSASK